MAGYIKNSDGGYSVNYEDERFQDVKTEQAQKEAEVNQNFDNMINNSDQYYQNQINAAQDYAKQQTEMQQAQTDFAVQQIEQKKEQAQKEYTREQKGAYVDYMKQTKSNAQNMANSGLSNTGYSESSIVSMYNAYQNRVGTAKESLNNTIMNYNNSITQATLANNEKLAEIAYNTLQMQNQLNQQAFEYKNTLLLEKEQSLQELNNTYYARYQNVLNQINSEIELQMALDQIDREYEQWKASFDAEQARFEEEIRQFNVQQQQWEREFALKKSESDAQASYYRAQAAAVKGSNNPYSINDSNTLSSAGSNLLNTFKSALNISRGNILKKPLEAVATKI